MPAIRCQKITRHKSQKKSKYDFKKPIASLFYGGGKPDDGAAAGRPQYLSTTTLHKHCKHQGPAEPEASEAKPFLIDGPSFMPNLSSESS